MGARVARRGVAWGAAADVCTPHTRRHATHPPPTTQAWREVFSKSATQRTAEELQEIDNTLASRVDFFL